MLDLKDLPEGVLCEVEHRSRDTTAEYHLRPTTLLSQRSPLQVACIRQLLHYMELHSGLGFKPLRIAHDPGEVWHANTDSIASLRESCSPLVWHWEAILREAMRWRGEAPGWPKP